MKTFEQKAQGLAASSASITQQLQQASGCHVDVDVICQGWRRPRHGEALLLRRYGLDGAAKAWVREVLLKTGDQYRVLARLLVPAADLPHVPWLQTLGAKPLGALVFAKGQPAPQRYCITPKYRRFSVLGGQFSPSVLQRAQMVGFQHSELYWSRHSVLVVPSEPPARFFITECFLY